MSRDTHHLGCAAISGGLAAHAVSIRLWGLWVVRVGLVAIATASLPAQAEYVVGVAAPVSGPYAQIGRSIRNGAALALEIAEDSGKFGEVRLSIRSIDDAGSPKEVAARMVRFVRDEMAILVIGPTLSPHAEVAADLANHTKFPLLAPGTSEGINAAGRWSFRLSMSPYRTIHALAARALSTGSGKRVALLHMQGNRGYASQAAEFRLATERLGGSAVLELPVNVEADFVEAAAKAIRDGKVDIVFLAMDAEPGAAVARALRSSALMDRKQDTQGERKGSIGGVRLVFAPAAAQPALVRLGGEAVEGALTAADYLAESAARDNAGFRNAYLARYGAEADNWAGIGFAAGQLAAEAVRNAGPNPSPETMRLALERVNDLSTILGGGLWRQDALRNPSYAPQLYVVVGGRLVPTGVVSAK